MHDRTTLVVRESVGAFLSCLTQGVASKVTLRLGSPVHRVLYSLYQRDDGDMFSN